jgi:hypothetical protein
MTLSAELTMRVLLDRLNWPVRFVRWRVAREYAALLSSGQRALARKVYLGWLKSRRMENEIVSGLSVLLVVGKEYLPTPGDVKASIRKPSILAEFLFQRIYRKVLGGWRDANSGAAPDYYQPDKYFEEHRGAAVPQILYNDLKELEDEQGLPFITQWAYEWRRIMDETNSPYSSFPYHFMDFAKARAGVSGQFSQAQCNVYRSAYLRTLSLAVSEWQMPPDRALFAAINCLPLNRGLEKLKPMRRPTWLADIPEKCCRPGAPLEKLARRIIKANIATNGMRPVSLRIPISGAVAEFGELSIEACYTSSDFAPKGSDDQVIQRIMIWRLADLLSYEGDLSERDAEAFRSAGLAGSMVPVCLNVWPVPLGFWLNEYAHLGMALPAPYNFPASVVVKCQGGMVTVEQGTQTVGRWRVWHDEWSPLHPSDDGHTRCGGVAEMGTQSLKAASTALGMGLSWFVELKIWRRPTEYGDLKLTKILAFFRD